MKKILIVVCIGIFLFSQVDMAWAETDLLYFDPMSHIPIKVRPMPLYKVAFTTPSAMKIDLPEMILPEAAPQEPALVSNTDGTKQIRHNGQLRIEEDTDGNLTLFAENVAQYKMDREGEMFEEYENRREGNTRMVTVKNEFDEIIRTEEHGTWGKLKEWDEEGNLSKNYEYNGRILSKIIDELYDGLTECNEYGKPVVEINFEGYEIGWYEYDNEGKGKLISYTDVDKQKTVYAERGRRALYIIDFWGDIIKRFFYDSNKWLSKTEDQYGNVTNYTKARRVISEENWLGELTRVFNWIGSKLISSEDKLTCELTTYKFGKSQETTNIDGIVVKTYVYENGIKVMEISHTDDQRIIYYDHGRIDRIESKSPNDSCLEADEEDNSFTVNPDKDDYQIVTIFYRYERGQMVETFQFLLEPESGIKKSTHYKNGRYINESGYTEVKDGKGNVIGYERYTTPYEYQNGRIYRKWDVNGGFIQYGEHAMVVAGYDYIPSTGKFVMTSRYTYDRLGRLIREEELAGNRLIAITEYSYNRFGKLASESTTYSDGRPKSSKEYSYLADGTLYSVKDKETGIITIYKFGKEWYSYSTESSESDVGEEGDTGEEWDYYEEPESGEYGEEI